MTYPKTIIDEVSGVEVSNPLYGAYQVGLVDLKKEIDIRRDNVFCESKFGSREHQLRMMAMVDAYDVCLNLIKEMLK